MNRYMENAINLCDEKIKDYKEKHKRNIGIALLANGVVDLVDEIKSTLVDSLEFHMLPEACIKDSNGNIWAIHSCNCCVENDFNFCPGCGEKLKWPDESEIN